MAYHEPVSGALYLFERINNGKIYIYVLIL